VNDPDPEPLLAVCSWCRKVRCHRCGRWWTQPAVRDPRCLGCGEPPAEARPGNVTHGVCEPCALRLLAETEHRPPRPEERPVPSDNRPSLPDDPAHDARIPAPPLCTARDDSAFPHVEDVAQTGMTFREAAALAALSRLAGSVPFRGEGCQTAEQACALACVRHADALIAALAAKEAP
jgi:hypothetical protein